MAAPSSFFLFLEDTSPTVLKIKLPRRFGINGGYERRLDKIW
jgi:hypothetical protein